MQHDDKAEADMAVLVKLYARVPVALAVNFFCTVGSAVVLWSAASLEIMSIWLGLMALALWLRFDGWRRFQGRQRSDQVKAWHHRFIRGAIATGSVWGLTSFFFYTSETGIEQTFLIFTVAGVVGGSLLTMTGSMQAFVGFLAATVAPFAIRFLLEGDQTHGIMAGMIALYIVGLIALARPMSQSLVSSVNLASINDRLITQLREKSSQLQATFDHVNQGVAVFDHMGCLLTWNPRHRELHGYPVHLYRPGTHLRQFLDQDLARSERLSGGGDLDARALAEPLAPVAFQQTGSEGRTLEVERSSMPGGGFVSTSTDITDHKRVEARMLHLAQHDPLTDLPNRLLFQDRLQQAMIRSTRSGSPVGVIVMDLDGFKAINDEEGHRIGDEVLKALARRLRSGLRETDTVARMGGDEFALILPDLTTATAAVRISEKMLANIETPLRIDDHDIDPRASLGIAMFPSDAQNAETLLQYADVAMYHAKHAGGGIRLAQPIIERHRTARPYKRKSSKVAG